jgi:hypothetical protein
MLNVKQNVCILADWKEKTPTAYIIIGIDEQFSKIRGCVAALQTANLVNIGHTLTLCQPAVSPVQGMKGKRDGRKSRQNSGEQQ